MTYCVGLKLNRGLVMMSDTRTNAGVDNIATYQKIFTWEVAGERVITLMTAGNLATSQALISTLDERNKTHDERNPSLLSAPTMFQAAKIVGEALRELIREASGQLEQSATFSSTLILSGQIKGGKATLFLIYPEGNFIEVSEETPFLQIGETKYGRPILVRAYDADMTFEDAIKLLLLSFDSTVKANLSVAAPFDLVIVEEGTFRVFKSARITEDDRQYQAISNGWGQALRLAFEQLPDINLADF